MDTSTSQYISLAWPIAVQRFITSQLIKDVPENFWDEDFFVMLAKEYKLTDIFNEVQNGLQDGEPSETPFGLGTRTISFSKLWKSNSIPKAEQVEQISVFILSKQVKCEMLDNSKRAKFRESFRTALETTIPLDEKEEQLIKTAKEAVASSDEQIAVPNGAVYEIRKFSPLFERHDLKKRVLDSLTAYQQGDNSAIFPSYDRIPAMSLQAADISLINEACSNDRFGAALTLAYAQTEDNRLNLLSRGVPKLLTEIVNMLRFPAAVEKEYLRGKSRFANFENCQKQLPNFMNLYSIFFQLRCERTKSFRFVEKFPERYRDAFEEDLLRLDNALGISDELILKVGFFRWLKKEHFNNVQDARIELFDSWVEDNLGEIGAALANRAVYFSGLAQELENLCSSLEPFGAEEKCLLSQARKVMPKAKSEIESTHIISMNEINRGPAPAA